MSVPMFFMKSLTSHGRTFPLASVPTVKSSALTAWRVASATRSAYCAEIADALPRMRASSAAARSCAPEKSAVNASICSAILSRERRVQ